jgi:hypothetical protein
MRVALRLLLACALALLLLVPAARSGVPSTTAQSLPPDEVTVGVLANAHPHFAAVNPASHGNGQSHTAQGIAGIDSLVNFNGHFHVAGFNSSGAAQSDWYINTVGHMPGDGGTTTINAPVIPVTLNLLDSNGQTRYVNGHPLIYDPSSYVTPTLNSPVFQNYSYSSSPTPTQFSDAIQRAEFSRQMAPSWHTLLNPSVKAGETMSIPRGQYEFALNPDGTCCAFVLVDDYTFTNLLYPPTYPVDNTTVVGQAELSGAITTKDIATFLFPNTFLYSFVNNHFVCCVLGYHGPDLEPGATPGSPLRLYNLNYSSWITPGLFRGGAAAPQDVTALSHEISETYNDPFVTFDGVHDITPWWLSPNGNCQNNLETGDVIEGLPNDTYPITMNGMTYHPQNEALTQWFESTGKSDALDGAFSYPDETVLPKANVSQKAGCQP